MKKIILAIALFAAVSAMIGHGSTTDMSAPLGSGLLLLAGMGLAYGFRKKN